MLSLRQKIAQMFIIGFDGAIIDNTSKIIQWLSAETLGGVLLFNYDVKLQRRYKNLINCQQIKSLIQQLQSVNRYNLPLFIGIDYEGGAVDRLQFIDDLPATVSVAKYAHFDLIQRHEYIHSLARTLCNLGFNLNFAPVVDLDLQNAVGIIGKLGRSYSSNPDIVQALALEWIAIFQQYNIVCCCKHFPGHGSAIGDTHHEFVDVTDTFQITELQPYQAILSTDFAKKLMIMTAHVVNRQLDPQGVPATLSFKILNDLLRQQIGFDGVIVSDDLQMRALTSRYDLREILCLTINAGADMLIIANQCDDIDIITVIDMIETLLTQGAIAISRIDAAYRRIVNLKQSCLGTVKK